MLPSDAEHQRIVAGERHTAHALAAHTTTAPEGGRVPPPHACLQLSQRNGPHLDGVDGAIGLKPLAHSALIRVCMWQGVQRQGELLVRAGHEGGMSGGRTAGAATRTDRLLGPAARTVAQLAHVDGLRGVVGAVAACRA